LLNLYEPLPSKQPMHYLQISDEKYISPFLLILLQIVSISLPLAVSVLIAGVNVHRASSYLSVQKFYHHYYYMHPQFMYFLKWFASFLIGYVVSQILPVTMLLPDNISAAKSQYTVTTNLIALGLVWATAFVVRFAFYVIGSKLPVCRRATTKRRPTLDFSSMELEVEELFGNERVSHENMLFSNNSLRQSPSTHRRLLLLVILSVFAVITMALNLFTATLLLILPCYLWPLMTPRRSETGVRKDEVSEKKQRAAEALKLTGNFVLLLTPLVFLLFLLGYFIWPLEQMLWYLTVSIIYRLIPPYVAIIWCGVASVGFSWAKYSLDRKVGGSKYVAFTNAGSLN